VPGVVADNDDELVDLRCSVVVVRGDELLLIRRGGKRDDWVLPGGRPKRGESLGSCARREALEETGLRVHPHRCALVGEVISPARETRVVEVVFLALLNLSDRGAPVAGEPDSYPQWVPVADLRRLKLRPPIGGYLPALVSKQGGTAAYLGNLWRPEPPDEAASLDDAREKSGETIWPT
jgi:8-oxo-dGTP diphosphatase